MKVPECSSRQPGVGAEPMDSMSVPRLQDTQFSMAVMGWSAPSKPLNTSFAAWSPRMHLYGRMTSGLGTALGLLLQDDPGCS